MERTITVAVHRLDELEKALASLRRTAKRLQIEPAPSLAIDWRTKREEEQQREVQIMDGGQVVDEQRSRRVVPVVDCALTLPEGGVKAEGEWHIAATLERVDGPENGQGRSENEVFCHPEDLRKLEGFRTADLCCEHCKVRRYRTHTVVVEEAASGRMIQVGKECATAYLGDRYESEVGILQFQAFVSKMLDPFAEEAERGFAGVGAPVRAWDSDEILAHACACVRTNGWESAWLPETDPGERPQRNPKATCDFVKGMLVGTYLHGEALATEKAKLKSEREKAEQLLAAADAAPGITDTLRAALGQRVGEAMLREQAGVAPPPYEIEEQDRVMAKNLLQWLSGQTPDPEKNRYMADLQAAFAPGWISEKRLGLAVSLVHAREIAAKREEFQRRKGLSQFVGTPGERRDFLADLVAARAYGGAFPGVAYKFYDENGSALCWMTSAGLPEGKRFRIKATVKKHEEFREEKVTQLGRVKVLEVLPDLQAAAPALASAEHLEGHAGAANQQIDQPPAIPPRPPVSQAPDLRTVPLEQLQKFAGAVMERDEPQPTFIRNSEAAPPAPATDPAGDAGCEASPITHATGKSPTHSIAMESWAGRTLHPCDIVGETRIHFQVRAAEDVRLPGERCVRAGEECLVPKHAVVANLPDPAKTSALSASQAEPPHPPSAENAKATVGSENRESDPSKPIPPPPPLLQGPDLRALSLEQLLAMAPEGPQSALAPEPGL